MASRPKRDSSTAGPDRVGAFRSECQLREYVPGSAGGGHGGLQQFVPARDAGHLGTTKLAQNAAGKEDGRPVTLQELAEHSRGVIALCPMPARLLDTSNHRGTIYRAPTKTRQSDADCHERWIAATSRESLVTRHFARLKDIFGDRLYI